MLELRPLSKGLAKIAVKELNENENRMKQDVEALREWLLTQPHLKTPTDDQFLVKQLRGCKYSIERTKEKIDLHYTTRTAMPDFFKNRDIYNARTRELLELGFIVPLPKTASEDGQRIMLVRPGAFDPSKYNVQDIMKAMTLLSDYQHFKDDNLLIAGFKVIFDAAGGKASHILQYEPMFLKKMSTFYQDSSVARFKGAYIVNVPSGLEAFMNIMKSFMNEKNRNRVTVLGSDLTQLYKHIPQKLFPTEYGGDAGSIKEILNMWIKLIEDDMDFLKKEEEYGADERKRIGNSKNAEGLFGTVGTFRNLSLD